MANSFTDQFAQISQTNLMGGLLLSAQADMMTKQISTTKDIMTSFSKKLQDVESSPLTTEEQLQRLQQDPDFQESAGDLSKYIADYQTLTMNVRNRVNSLTNLYGNTALALSAVGGDVAERISGVLDKQLSDKTQAAEQYLQVPAEALKLRATLMDIEAAKLSIESSKLSLQQVKDNKEATAVLAKMISSDEFTQMNLSYNTATGKPSYNLNKFKESMAKLYGDNPAFLQAWLALDEHIRKNTQTWRPEFRSAGMGDANTIQRLSYSMELYNTMRDVTAYTNKILYGGEDEYVQARAEYLKAAQQLYPNAKQTDLGTYYVQDKENKSAKSINSFNFGADPRVIDAMEDDVAAKYAKQIYEYLYDDSPKNDNYYWKYLEALESSSLLGQQLSGYTQSPTIVVNGKQFIFDTSQILTKSGGMYNPDPRAGTFTDPKTLNKFLEKQNRKRQNILKESDLPRPGNPL
jgi:glutaredoxin